MYYNTNTNEVIKSPKTITIGDITYPKAIFKDKEFLSANGIKPYREEPVDSRYYWQGEKTVTDTGSEVVATYAKIDRLIEDRAEVDEDGSPMLDENGNQVITTGLKTQMISKVKQQQASQLDDIDWYWLRELKTGIAVPQEIQDEATAIYADAEAKEAEIEALTTIDDIIAYENPVEEV